jgi:uncharacterized integral membrane protein (TIGR00697 family)
MNKLRNIKNISFVQMMLTLLFVVALLVSNVITSKQVLLPGGIVMTGAVFIFPITYILSDVFSEIYGYRWSRLTCYMGFAANLFMVIVFSLVIVTPAPDFWTHQEAFQTVLGNTPRIWVASMLAFMIGDLVNDKVFRRMKQKYPTTHQGFGWRAIISSFVGEVIDSAIFLPLAFIGQMPVESLIQMMIAQVFIKTGYEVMILPVTYRVVKFISKLENSVQAVPKTVYNYDNKQIQK